MKNIYNYGQEGRKYMAEKDLATEDIYKTDNRALSSQSRDILKKYHNKTHLVISSFGIDVQDYKI